LCDLFGFFRLVSVIWYFHQGTFCVHFPVGFFLLLFFFFHLFLAYSLFFLSSLLFLSSFDMPVGPRCSRLAKGLSPLVLPTPCFHILRFFFHSLALRVFLAQKASSSFFLQPVPWPLFFGRFLHPLDLPTRFDTFSFQVAFSPL